MIARRDPRRPRHPVEQAVSDAVDTVSQAASTVVAGATKRWFDGGGQEAVSATVSLGVLAAHVAVAHARAAAAALGLRRPPPDPPVTVRSQ